MANNAKEMSTADIYEYLRTCPKAPCNRRQADRLVEQFHSAATFLARKLRTGEWQTWRDNYLREHAGCALSAHFSNTWSPYLNELVIRKSPYLRKYQDGSYRR